jgi:hypothetical protein
VYFLGATSRQLRVEVNGEVQSYDVAQVQLVFFANPTDTPPVPAATRADASIGIAIPSDTAITVRTIDSVNSDIARTGHTFMASPDEPVCVDGGSVIPRGADVMPKLVYDQQAGKLRGRTVLTLALVPVKANGHWVDVTSTDVRRESDSQTAKSAQTVGGVTASGAIIGGIARGGKGAAIGAGSCAVAGAGATVMTSGEKVVIPSETRLTLRLQSPAQL